MGKSVREEKSEIMRVCPSPLGHSRTSAAANLLPGRTDVHYRDHREQGVHHHPLQVMTTTCNPGNHRTQGVNQRGTGRTLGTNREWDVCRELPEPTVLLSPRILRTAPRRSFTRTHCEDSKKANFGKGAQVLQILNNKTLYEFQNKKLHLDLRERIVGHLPVYRGIEHGVLLFCLGDVRARAGCPCIDTIEHAGSSVQYPEIPGLLVHDIN